MRLYVAESVAVSGVDTRLAPGDFMNLGDPGVIAEPLLPVRAVGEARPNDGGA